MAIDMERFGANPFLGAQKASSRVRPTVASPNNRVANNNNTQPTKLNSIHRSTLANTRRHPSASQSYFDWGQTEAKKPRLARPKVIDLTTVASCLCRCLCLCRCRCRYSCSCPVRRRLRPNESEPSGCIGDTAAAAGVTIHLGPPKKRSPSAA